MQNGAVCLINAKLEQAKNLETLSRLTQCSMQVLFKLENTGAVVLIKRESLTLAKEVSLVGFTEGLFRQMCILSGCDYLPSIPGMGLKKAHKYIKRWKNAERVIKQCRFDGMKVPPNYLEEFKRAEATFVYQRVYDPVAKVLTTLCPLPDTFEGPTDYIGWYVTAPFLSF